MVSYTQTVLSQHSSDSARPTDSNTATLESLPSVPRTPIFGSVSHSLPRMRSLGYSSSVLQQLLHSRLPSSNRTYESRWRLFEAFCRDRSADAFVASPALVADFLVWLAHTRSASYSTIAGYCSAIGLVLRLATGYSPGTCPVLAQLMQSFRRTQPLP